MLCGLISPSRDYLTVLLVFEIVIMFVFIVSGDKIIFTSNNKYETKTLCSDAIQNSGYEQLKEHVLSMTKDEFTVTRECRSVEKGA